MNQRKYRYERKDFHPLPVRMEHMTISLNFLDDGAVDGSNSLRMTALKPMSILQLDASDLEIFSVEQLARQNTDKDVSLSFHYDSEKNKLDVELAGEIGEGETFEIKTHSRCIPTGNILEGIYKDTTPPGCPQQYMSQCQQWGFQRILPVLDDCTAKCTMTTTIEADARYTHLISNGNINRQTNPDGKPVKKTGEPGRQIITYENPVPMAPYLFIVTVGTWDVVEDEVTYPSGKQVRLEYLVSPGKKDGAAIPMQILKDSVLWQAENQDYEYKHNVYRTICMEKSNFGGMENVGNTTIVTDAALVDEYTNDRRLQYAHGVIIHEFEHNECGSDVTMETPFDMWLNEAYTVDVERRYMKSRFDPDYRRLEEVDSMRAPVGGPLSIEDTGLRGNIVREGFNHPDELVDGVTYVKAAEVMQMLRLILGANCFEQCRKLYFKRYAGSNANTDQFFATFEEASGKDLSQFRKEWLHTIGYPNIRAEWSYNPQNQSLTIRLTQSRTGKGGMFHLPFTLTAVDKDGTDIQGTDRIVELKGKDKTITLKDVAEPAFVSFNRGCSFYGTFEDITATPEMIARQARTDPDGFNRAEAMQRLTDIEKINLITDPDSRISELWIKTYRSVLEDNSIPAGLSAHILGINEQTLSRRYVPFYREKYNARITLLREISASMQNQLLDRFNSVNTYKRPSTPRDGIEERMLKAVLLRSLIELDTPEIHELAEAHFRKAWNITDKVNALGCIYLSSYDRKHERLEEAFHLWKDNISGYSSYLSLIGRGRDKSVFEMIKQEESRSTFNMQHPTLARSLYLPLSRNNKLIWTDHGINWLTEKVIELAPVNERTAILLVNTFQRVRDLSEDLKPKVTAALGQMAVKIDSNKFPSIGGRIQTFLTPPNKA